MRWAAATPPPAQGGAPPAPRPRSAAAWTHRPLPALPSAPPRARADAASAPPRRPRGLSRRLCLAAPPPRAAPAQRPGVAPPPAPRLAARLAGRPHFPGGSPRGRRPSELTRPPAAAAAPPPTNQLRAAPRRAPIGPGGKRGSDRRAAVGWGGTPPIPVPGCPHPYSHPHPLRRAPPARCLARGYLSRRCLHPPSWGSAPLRSKAQPSLPAAPPVPAGLGAENSPCPFLPYLRAGLRRALSGRLRGQLPRHYRIFRPGSGAGDGEPPVQRSRLSCWGERGSDRGSSSGKSSGADGTLFRCCRTPGGGGERLGPRRHVSNFGETRFDRPPPTRPFSARTSFLSRREKSRPLRNNQKSETNKKPQKKTLERRPGDNPGMLQIRKGGGTTRAEIPEKSEPDRTAGRGTGGGGETRTCLEPIKGHIRLEGGVRVMIKGV
ncbi:formin-like protein 5 [Motacilla alba alba]|uniref:formin-like protein 5 n=1 Tax=Motacilla alba alba TaxID=1094192 RepID=UPI0018D51DA0|nr:formin-like protein 5 [Motacilla alba alba]